MDTHKFIDNYITKIKDINESNIIKYNYKLKDNLPEKEVKEIQSYKEMKKFTDTRKKYYEKQTNIDQEENFNIFEKNNINTDEESNKNFFELDYDDKKDYILDYIKRKKIKLSDDLDSIKEIIEDSVKLKKYVSIDKTFNIISKISFFKKNEYGNHYISLNDIKRTKKNFFK